MENQKNNITEKSTEALETVEVVGIKFREGGKTYYFAPGKIVLNKDDHAIVETARGMEFGICALGNRKVKPADIVSPLKPVVRVATEDDERRHEQNKVMEEKAKQIFLEKVQKNGLEMQLVDVEYTFDNSKLIFYFTADGRVDFRELVKDLASVFRTRIGLRQIGVRDEAKLIGGLGVCGRPFCCKEFLPDFAQVSIKMAKEQNLSLNSAKISGACGRLMCCLRFEHESYQQEIRMTPPVDSTVKTQDGVGQVTEIAPLTGMIKVNINDSIKSYHRDNVKVLSLPKGKKKKDEDEDVAE